MTARPIQIDPRSFGRRAPFTCKAAALPAPAVGDDVKLFTMTWLAGFLFASIFIA